MTCSTRIEYVVHAHIELPDGSCYNLRHVFTKLSDARDVAAWFRRQDVAVILIKATIN